jgi:broad specificity phosphatase PhoE
MRRRLILMRHGAVRYFEPDSPKPLPPEDVTLTAEGEAQARAAGALLAAAGVRPDRIVHSGLPRTRRTAELVREPCAGPALEVREAFQEIHGGRLRDIAPHRLRDAFSALNRGPLTAETRFLGGESLGELQARLLPAFEQLRAEADWDCLLLVAHGVVNAALLSYLVSGGGRQVFGGWQQNPACLNLIDLGAQPGEDLLRAVNLNPTDGLQPGERRSTMEKLFEEFVAWRRRHSL